MEMMMMVSRSRRAETVPHDVAMELIKKLPDKARMRFKCVSKAWYSSINNGTTLPLIISFSNSSFSERYFFTIKHDHSQEASHHLTLSSYFITPHQVTQLINGFICFYNSFLQISMRNVFTQEIIDVPRSNFISDDDEDDDGDGDEWYKSKYFLGFDPSSQDYKVLNVSNKRKTSGTSFRVLTDFHGSIIYPECEIFTLGTNSWRRIDAPRFRLHFRRQSLCVNGFIHWIITNPRETKPLLGLFDVKNETFSVAKLPEEVRGEHHDLVQVEEKLGLLDCQDFRSKNKIRIWIRQKDEVWIRRDYVLPPFDTMMMRRPIPVSNSNTGELLLTEYKSSLNVSRVFIYDLKTQQRRTIKIPPITENNVLKFLDLKRAKLSATYYVELPMPE